ncbi:hypothetical protein NIES2104_35410 [Leptolyngbya sp. NIES-2104]|nr:hypothetical protein NIES2104_35410 [Leptolyngbya sp. NIES-2104]
MLARPGTEFGANQTKSTEGDLKAMSIAFSQFQLTSHC